MRYLTLSAALAASLICGAVHAAPAPAEAPFSVKMAGRTATISLPYKASDKLIWVSATRMSDAAPFMFKSLAIAPHAGPGGLDMAVFTYVADRPGAAKLTFGLVPPGKMLIGPPSLVYKGPPARLVSVPVKAP
jgi:hypothetical protein